MVSRIFHKWPALLTGLIIINPPAGLQQKNVLNRNPISTYLPYYYHRGSSGGGDRMLFGFTTTYAISAYKPLTLWVRIPLMERCVIKIAAGRWFSPGIPVSSINKTINRHDISEILLKVALNTINLNIL